MNAFLEDYFKVIALFFTVFTSIIFLSYLILRKKIIFDEETKFPLPSTIIVSIYELIHIINLIYTANNVILKLYTVFLTVSLLMLIISEVLYMIEYYKLKSQYEKLKTEANNSVLKESN